jgi:predicted phage terminase large subunit-like protein
MDLFDQLPNEVLIEDKGSGQQLIQDLQRETNYAIIAMEPGGIDKVTRMANESPVIEAGQMWVPEEAPWLFDFEQEISNFPNAPNDDQVDMVSQYLKRQREGGDIFIG